jgi:hypothetical protein
LAPSGLEAASVAAILSTVLAALDAVALAYVTPVGLIAAIRSLKLPYWRG